MDTAVSFGRYRFLASTGQLWCGQREVRLTPRAAAVLAALVARAGQMVTKEELFAEVWRGTAVSDDALTSCIQELRKALADDPKQPRFIETRHRRGYRFVSRLRHSASDVPAKETEVRTEEHGRADAPATSGGTAVTHVEPAHSGGKPTIAVLPFDNMSGDPDQEYFSDGITDDIITALSKHRSLLVVARTSTFAFKGHRTDVRRLGVNLGAQYVVEGSVGKTGQRLRVRARLVETGGGSHVWAEQYDRDLDRMFDIQDDITTTIAARIEPEVGAAERQRVEKRPPPELGAWDMFHLGLKHIYSASTRDNAEAQRLFRRAIELDPTLAPAYAWLSYAIVLSMLYFDVGPDEDQVNEAVALASRGVELDDRDAMTYFAYGRALLARKAYPHALAELEIARELNPNLAVVYCGLGDSLAYEGRFDEAIPFFEKAISLSPHDPQRWAFYSYRALAHLFAGQFADAQEWALKATRVPNCHYWPFAHRVSALGHLRDNEALPDARAELLRRQRAFSCAFAEQRLFYVKNPAHLERYLEGLRNAGFAR
ncbi:MAG TPA: winged helix-turn-helix domain-containing protein [Vicinamibacterales bacterium]|nr:winged helix-turn-helix domain-containing protein [Vicinamibacterales bacterium]